MTEQELNEMNEHTYSDVEKAIRETRIEWYERGKRDGREEVKAALRELVDVERIEK